MPEEEKPTVLAPLGAFLTLVGSAIIFVFIEQFLPSIEATLIQTQVLQIILIVIAITSAVWFIHLWDKRKKWVPNQREKMEEHHKDLIENTYKPLSGLGIYFSWLPNPLEITVGYFDSTSGKTRVINELPDYEYGLRHLESKEYEKVSNLLFGVLDDVNKFNSEMRKEVDDVALEESIKKVLPHFQEVTMEAARGFGQYAEAKPNQYVREWLWQAVVSLLTDSQSEIDRITASPVGSVILRITNTQYVLQMDGHDVAKGTETDLRILLGELVKVLPRLKELRTKQETYDTSRKLVQAFHQKENFPDFLETIETKQQLAGRCHIEDILDPPYGIFRITSWTRRLCTSKPRALG